MALQSNSTNFLFENSYRSFPFEDSSEIPQKISFSSILDIKGFSRSPIAGKIALIGASRWDTGQGKPDSGITEISELMEEGKIQLYFSVPSYPVDLYIQIGVSISETDWPSYTTDSIKNEAGTDYIQLAVVWGETILSDLSETQYVVFSDTHLEQTVIMECYKKSIDQFAILHSNGSKEYVRGSIEFANGTNSSVEQSGKIITITAREGNGEGMAINTGTEVSDKCNGILYIAGIQPSREHKFTIEGGIWVSVTDDPANHKIIISIQPDSRLLECSAAP